MRSRRAEFSFSSASPFSLPGLGLNYLKLSRVMFLPEEVTPSDLVDAYLLRSSVEVYYGRGGEAPFYQVYLLSGP